MFSTKTFEFKETLTYCAYFLIIFAALNLILNLLNLYIIHEEYFPIFWPIGEFVPRIFTSFFVMKVHHPEIYLHCQLKFINLIVAFIYGLFFYIVISKIESFKSPLFIYIVGVVSIFLSNLIQGYENGFMDPVNGGGFYGIQYYDDAIKINDAMTFLHNYNSIQPGLLMHSSTHPPGAVLVYYFLNKISQNPAFTSVILMCISLLSIFYLYKIISIYFNKETASIISLIFIFLPATQIYYLSSIDSVIAFASLGLIYHYLTYVNNQKIINFVPIIIFLLLLSFLTYMVVFPISLVMIDLLRKKNLKIMVQITLLLIGIYVFYLMFNFEYISGFLTSSHIENPYGFRLFSSPASYMITRLESIAEILLFFGPLSIVTAARGLKYNLNDLNLNDLIILSCAAVLLLLLLFVAGFARRGETARCCLFIYPFLLVFIANYINNNTFTVAEKRQFLIILWLQSVLMQIVGYYFW